MIRIITNPDYEWAQQRIKEIKKNNKFCRSAMSRDPSWKCPCEKFRNAPVGTWCCEELYYKKEEINE